MKTAARSILRGLFCAALLCFPATLLTHAQTADAPANNAVTAPAEKPEAAESTEEFRHAPKVEAIARVFHVSTETAAQIFEDLNSGILILLILFGLFKVLPKAMRNRTATLQKQLVEARSATELANERLTAVEARLAKLGGEIDAIRQQTDRDMVEDEKRIKQTLEDERVRIIKAAEQEIDSAGAAAQRDLKRFAAELAIDRAAQRIQLGVESDREIVARFGHELAAEFGKGGRN